MWIRRVFLISALLATTLLGFFAGHVWSNGFSVQTLSLFAAAVTALATAAAALFSWRASSSSETAAREATKALSFATKPSIYVDAESRSDPDGSPFVLVQLANTSDFTASDVHLTWKLRDGTVGSRSLGTVLAKDNLYDPENLRLPLSQTDGVDEYIATYRGPQTTRRWKTISQWTFSASGYASKVIFDGEESTH
ncbi:MULTISPECIES: hypothetical protein [unclassified Leucobacter]|uniref:hypothetical protein n=1 Tax=unclassified Leucobacter TaxID=2621730 RepID=UPI00117A42F5|nr:MULTISPECIES: hypothetical protein [unclassified Leucobacter]